MTMSSVNCASGNAPLAMGAVGSLIYIPFLGDFGPIMGGALTGYATEMYCQKRFVSPVDHSALTAMGYGAMGGAAGLTARMVVGI